MDRAHNTGDHALSRRALGGVVPYDVEEDSVVVNYSDDLDSLQVNSGSETPFLRIHNTNKYDSDNSTMSLESLT
jgi:hypothetical protein